MLILYWIHPSTCPEMLWVTFSKLIVSTQLPLPYFNWQKILPRTENKAAPLQDLHCHMRSCL